MQNIIDALPKDPASLFTLILVIALVVGVIVIGRRSGKEGPKIKDPE